MHDLQNRNSQLGKLNLKYHIQDRLTKLVSNGGGSLVGGVLGAGALVLPQPCPPSSPSSC